MQLIIVVLSVHTLCTIFTYTYTVPVRTKHPLRCLSTWLAGQQSGDERDLIPQIWIAWNAAFGIQAQSCFDYIVKKLAHEQSRMIELEIALVIIQCIASTVETCERHAKVG